MAYTLYFRGLRTAPAGTAALLSLLEPLTGTVLAAIILGDRLGASGTAGAVILAAALVLAGVAGQAARQATAVRTTEVAQPAVTAHSGTRTANACHTAGAPRVPAARTRADVTA